MPRLVMSSGRHSCGAVDIYVDCPDACATAAPAPRPDEPALSVTRSQLSAVLGAILDDYQSETGRFGAGSAAVAPELLAMIVTNRLRGLA
jgi:hypothetical protein